MLEKLSLNKRLCLFSPKPASLWTTLATYYQPTDTLEYCLNVLESKIITDSSSSTLFPTWSSTPYPIFVQNQQASHCVRSLCRSLCNIQSRIQSFRSLSPNWWCIQRFVWLGTQTDPGGTATGDIERNLASYPTNSTRTTGYNIHSCSAWGMGVVWFRTISIIPLPKSGLAPWANLQLLERRCFDNSPPLVKDYFEPRSWWENISDWD